MTNKVVCCGETNFRCDSRINHVDAADSHTVSNVRPWIATRSTSTEEESWIRSAVNDLIDKNRAAVCVYTNPSDENEKSM